MKLKFTTSKINFSFEIKSNELIKTIKLFFFNLKIKDIILTLMNLF